MAPHAVLEPAEQDLLAMIRLAATKDFSILVTCDTGRWTVAAEDFSAGTKVIGQGSSFAEAWKRRMEVDR